MSPDLNFLLWLNTREGGGFFFSNTCHNLDKNTAFIMRIFQYSVQGSVSISQHYYLSLRRAPSAVIRKRDTKECTRMITLGQDVFCQRY